MKQTSIILLAMVAINAAIAQTAPKNAITVTTSQLLQNRFEVDSRTPGTKVATWHRLPGSRFEVSFTRRKKR
jgi:hypothetical protein